MVTEPTPTVALLTTLLAASLDFSYFPSSLLLSLKFILADPHPPTPSAVRGELKQPHLRPLSQLVSWLGPASSPSCREVGPRKTLLAIRGPEEAMPGTRQ